jgi:hypothetical protein
MAQRVPCHPPPILAAEKMTPQCKNGRENIIEFGLFYIAVT